MKRKIIMSSALLVVLLHLFPLLTKRELYPFVSYPMFAKARTEPVVKRLFIYTLDENKNEEVIEYSEKSRMLMAPFNSRGLSAAVSGAIKRKGLKQALSQLLKTFRSRDDAIKGLRAYVVTCPCGVRFNSSHEVDSYVDKNCLRKFIGEVYGG